MMKRYLLLSVLTISLFSLSCSSGGSSSGGGNDTVIVSGTWKGSGYAPETGTHPTTLILSQSGNMVSGTWDGYAFTGTVSVNQLTLTLTPFTQNGVYMTGSSNSTVTGNSMSGTLLMTGRVGSKSTTINGTFTATRSDAKYIPGSYPASGFLSTLAGAIAN